MFSEQLYTFFLLSEKRNYLRDLLEEYLEDIKE